MGTACTTREFVENVCVCVLAHLQSRARCGRAVHAQPLQLRQVAQRCGDAAAQLVAVQVPSMDTVRTTSECAADVCAYVSVRERETERVRVCVCVCVCV